MLAALRYRRMARKYVFLSAILCLRKLAVGVIVDTSRDDSGEGLQLQTTAKPPEDFKPPEDWPTQDWLVDSSQLGSTSSIGVTYRKSKHLQDEALNYEVYGTVVTGVDTRDGWVYVDRLGYLPKQINGKTVLKKQKPVIEQERTYLVDNSQLQSKRDGLTYRRSKNLDDKDPEAFARYGSRVSGVDEGDGWLRVGEHLYLPFQVKGAPVLELSTAKTPVPAAERKTEKDFKKKASASAEAAKPEEFLHDMGKIAVLAPLAVFLVVGVVHYVHDWYNKRQPYRRLKEEPPPVVEKKVAKAANKLPSPAAPASISRLKPEEDADDMAPRQSVKQILSAFEKRRG